MLRLLLLAWVVTGKEQVTFTLGGLGDITGTTTQTKVYPTAPHSNSTYYRFRNIPFARPFDRFGQSELWEPSQPLSESGPYDAVHTGPLCHQGGLDPQVVQEFKDQMLVELVLEVGGPLLAIAVGILISTINQILGLDPSVLGPMDGSKKVGDIIIDWLDIDLSVSEDCLHLAVSTPLRPDGSQKTDLPVMFFIHGGAFYGGTQIRMGAERLGAWEDVVVVAINYRVGPLGFMCLDTDNAAGNMGLLDMVTALEWVHQYISYFGGDPSRITIFGESAGSAAIGHLLLSDVTSGLFSQGIGQSGSALASWAFDNQGPERHALDIAEKVGCQLGEGGDHGPLVDCLKLLPAVNISKAFKDYSKEDRAKGGMGFGGSIPCAQTMGAKQFYTADQTPEQLLHSGQYEKVPIMFGANSHEGSFVYATVYNSFFVPNNLTNNTDFLTKDLTHQLLQTVEIGNSYPVEYLVEESYFEKEQLGDLMAMQPAIIDLLGVFFLKASSYEFMVESVDQGTQAYWYSFEYAAADKSAFHALFSAAADKAGITDPGVCHGDELIYLFDIELPLALCDISEIEAGIYECLNADGLTLNIPCIEGDFRERWHWCVTGELTEEELEVSATLASMWTKFAASGDPGHGARPWSREEPWYSRITTGVEQALNYRQNYHVASGGGGSAGTTTTSPCGDGETCDCPDGWVRLEVSPTPGETLVDCVLVGGPEELVTKEDAVFICSAHSAYLAELSHGQSPQTNNFLKNLIYETVGEGNWFEPGPHYDGQWWLGATCSGPHSDHNYGNWTWDQAQTEVTYFDWGQDEPSDSQTENCLTYLPTYGPFGSYNLNWNDWDCGRLGRYICLKSAAGY